VRASRAPRTKPRPQSSRLYLKSAAHGRRPPIRASAACITWRGSGGREVTSGPFIVGMGSIGLAASGWTCGRAPCRTSVAMGRIWRTDGPAMPDNRDPPRTPCPATAVNPALRDLKIVGLAGAESEDAPLVSVMRPVAAANTLLGEPAKPTLLRLKMLAFLTDARVRTISLAGWWFASVTITLVRVRMRISMLAITRTWNRLPLELFGQRLKR